MNKKGLSNVGYSSAARARAGAARPPAQHCARAALLDGARAALHLAGRPQHRPGAGSGEGFQKSHKEVESINTHFRVLVPTSGWPPGGARGATPPPTPSCSGVGGSACLGG
eukprot:1910317-Alexandrium_andersonii.AAC.1